MKHENLSSKLIFGVVTVHLIRKLWSGHALIDNPDLAISSHKAGYETFLDIPRPAAPASFLRSEELCSLASMKCLSISGHFGCSETPRMSLAIWMTSQLTAMFLQMATARTKSSFTEMNLCSKYNDRWSNQINCNKVRVAKCPNKI